jgi:hypothetical protein
MSFTFGSIKCFVAERREPPVELPSDLRTFTGQIALSATKYAFGSRTLFFFLNFEFQQGSVGMFARILVCSLFVFSFVSGCGSSETVIPTTELTAEQQAAVKREDAAVAEDESQGKLPKPKAKK